MSRSAGAGSPVWFMCWRARRTTRRHRDRSLHLVSRTGRTRPYWPKTGSATGVRSMKTSHEYVCDCGHRGWTNHIDIMSHPVQTDPMGMGWKT